MASGKDLRLRRIAMDVTASALADRIGVSSAAVSRWENSLRVTAAAEERYLRALATFGTIPTVDVTVRGAA